MSGFYKNAEILATTKMISQPQKNASAMAVNLNVNRMLID